LKDLNIGKKLEPLEYWWKISYCCFYSILCHFL